MRCMSSTQSLSDVQPYEYGTPSKSLVHNPVTIGIVTVVVGDTYLAKIHTWAKAVSQLDRQPDVVTLVTDHMPRKYVEILDDALPRWQLITTKRTWRHHPQVLVNDAIAETKTDWICKMDADDIILPHALSPIGSVSGDIWMFGMRRLNDYLYSQPVTFQQVLGSLYEATPVNYVNSGSPFRKHLWTGNPYRDMIYEDWAFWIGCAKQKAIFKSSPSIDYEYVVHDQQISANIDNDYWVQKVRELV